MSTKTEQVQLEICVSTTWYFWISNVTMSVWWFGSTDNTILYSDSPKSAIFLERELASCQHCMNRYLHHAVYYINWQSCYLLLIWLAFGKSMGVSKAIFWWYTEYTKKRWILYRLIRFRACLPVVSASTDRYCLMCLLDLIGAIGSSALKIRRFEAVLEKNIM